MGKTREAICDDELLVCCALRFWDRFLRWAPTVGMFGAICDTTELIAALIGVRYVRTGAILGGTGINCGAIYAMEIIGLRDVSGAIFTATDVT